jgi:hypothetical protein
VQPPLGIRPAASAGPRLDTGNLDGKLGSSRGRIVRSITVCGHSIR